MTCYPPFTFGAPGKKRHIAISWKSVDICEFSRFYPQNSLIFFTRGKEGRKLEKGVVKGGKTGKEGKKGGGKEKVFGQYPVYGRPSIYLFF